MTRQYHLRSKAGDILEQYFFQKRVDESYSDFTRKIFQEHLALKEQLDNEQRLATLVTAELKAEYDAIWRLRSYATDKNLQILLEAMNALLLQTGTPPKTTEQEKSVVLSVSETAVNDRLARLRIQSMTKKRRGVL